MDKVTQKSEGDISCEGSEKNKENDQVNFVIPSLPVHKFVKPQLKSTKEAVEAEKVDIVDSCDNKQEAIKLINNEKTSIEPSDDTKKMTIPSYSEPPWGGPVGENMKYALTVLKDGIVKDTIALCGKSMISFGRQDECDVVVEHPSCSRYHALLQYCIEENDKRKKGFYLYDLNSTHGTYLNKEKLKSKVYSRLRVGYQIKFGGSSRLYIMEGPEEDQEEEFDLDVIREKRRQYEQLMAEKKQKQYVKSNKNKSSVKQDDSNDQHESDDDDEGANWGFGEDAKEEGLNLKELFERKKDIEVKDPKKTLRGFFDREGIEFEYEMSVRGSNNSVIHVAQVRLPIETLEGVEVIAEGTASNKKDAVLACATDACQLIHAYDAMQNTSREDQALKRKKELEANDFYESDDDTYLDRTGSVEKKRLKRKKWAGKMAEKDEVDTHYSLKVKLENKETELAEMQKKLDLSKIGEQSADEDSLDAYMSSMKHALDKPTITKLKREIVEMKKEIEKLKKLIEKTRPTLLPVLKVPETRAESNSSQKKNFETSPSVVTNNDVSLNTTTTKEENIGTLELQTNHDEKKNSEPPAKKAKRKRVYGAPMKPNRNRQKPEKKESDFVEWLPPEGQTGDGRTALNDKLGY